MRTLHRNICVFQQTKILLWKNVLSKWRRKRQSFQEWILSLLFLSLVYIISLYSHYFFRRDVPYAFLGQLNGSTSDVSLIAYTPVTSTTKEIMNKVASKSVMMGICFKTIVAYNHAFPFILDADLCYNFSATYCKNPEYWYKGFLALQSSIDAAIIEMKTNHSVWKEMNSISGVRMKSPSLLNSMTWGIYFTLFVTAMCFSTFLQVLSTNMTREKKNIKVLMKMMGLQDSAFWLSWSLLYAAYVFIMSCLMTAVSFYEEFYLSSFFPIVFLFFLYGISSIHFTFLISSIFKKPKTTSTVVFLLLFLSGFLSIILLIRKPPVTFEWVFGFLSPFVFNAGIAKVKNIIDKYGTPYPPLFFLKSSYWVKSQRRYDGGRSEFEQNCDHAFGDNVEPVPPEFAEKEVIRISNIKKTYGKKEKQVEVLRGLSLNIYEGQITALLGHSGAGKTTLLNVLSGLTEASEGSATIFNYRMSEVRDKDRIRERIGFCPQFNLQFEALTVKENLQVFAGIKGILSSEAEREVKNVLTQLDMIHIQDKQADEISSGQKRSLSLAIAMLGNPQVLLLDEPTAGMDPFSMYQVWNLLKDGKAGRVTLFSTRFMHEADILADRKAFISHGKLKCVGSSLFLKKKWGIGYHLRMHTGELCHSEEMTSLVKEYIPNATFSGQRENELEYVLPLETVDKFPDLFCGLDSHSGQGIINYGVTVTSLEDVFLKLEGEEAIAEGKIVEEEKEPFSVDGVEQDLSPSNIQRMAVTGMALWRQQVCAMARLRLLRLKKNYNFTILCHLEVINCYPVLMNIISNALLAASNFTGHIRVWNSPLFNVSVLTSLSEMFQEHIVLKELANGSIHVQVLNRKKARSQLRISGLFPSAYWCGQALVDTSLTWILLISMFGMYFAMSKQHTWDVSLIFSLVNEMILITCCIGYGTSMVLFLYLIAFIFCKGCSSLFLSCALIPYIHCVAFIFLLRYLEMKYGRAVLRGDPVFRISPRKEPCHQNPEEPEEEDEDVQTERANIRHAIASQHEGEKPLIIVSNLRKEYEVKKAGSVFKNKKKVSVKNISFCVKKGEIFGLLGPSGAGKSTTINMISGETTLSAGQVAGSQLEASAPGFLSYCPQENPLWPTLTVQEHLEIYAAVKGLRKEDAAVTIFRIVKALELQKYFKKAARELPAWITKKLCLALSLLGNPTVVLLDEPSAGMDPRGQSQVWKVIRSALKSKQQGAILTTHCMEEAEAVCDRVAILVSGWIQCIGSIQYLKSKFGKGYLLEIKLKDSGQADQLHTEILRIFPQAARQERFSSLLVYKVPVEDALPLSQAFSKMERGRNEIIHRRKESLMQGFPKDPLALRNTPSP
uniref:ATP-binding cassette sub-family A member 10-like n=1 Tax=Crocodylus porosus TaxID=8502 RepID=A0A7M4FND9_CROPO